MTKTDLFLGLLIGLWYGSMINDPYKSWILFSGVFILGITCLIMVRFTILVMIDDYKHRKAIK